MTLPIALPYGLRDVKLRTLTGDVAGTPSIDLPNAQTFSFAEAEAFTELRGDDGLVAVHGKGPAVNWDLTGGGCCFEAIKAMFGGTITTTGTTPATQKTFKKLGTDTRPYFQVEGQSISDSGGDFHCLVYKCRATGDLTGAMTDGAFWISGAKGTALPNGASELYEFTQNETAVAIV
jgi:hypothetical protein